MSSAFEADTKVPFIVKPWEAIAPEDSLDAEEQYIGVHTWIKVPFSHLPSFFKSSDTVQAELRGLGPDKVLGILLGIQLSISPGPILETFTVWRKREHMAAFVQGPSHREAMARFGREQIPSVQFGVRRFLVGAEDLPGPNDRPSSKAFVVRASVALDGNDSLPVT